MAFQEHSTDMLGQFGRNIRRLREMRGLSQERLAEMVGYKSRTSINKIEMGKTDIGQKTIAKIAEALGVTAADIVPNRNAATFNLYDRIDFLCRENQLSGSELCRETGISEMALTDLADKKIYTLSSVELKRISVHFNTPLSFLLGEQPFRYWEEMLNDKKGVIQVFIREANRSETAIQTFYGPCSADYSDMDDYEFMRLVSEEIESATPLFDSWVITVEDLDCPPQKNTQEAAAATANLSDVKAKFIESVYKMTDEQVLLLQAVVDQVLRENGLL